MAVSSAERYLQDRTEAQQREWGRNLQVVFVQIFKLAPLSSQSYQVLELLSSSLLKKNQLKGTNTIC